MDFRLKNKIFHKLLSKFGIFEYPNMAVHVAQKMKLTTHFAIGIISIFSSMQKLWTFKIKVQHG